MEHDWTYSVYGNVTEALPDDAPEPLGKPVVTTTFVDANLYHCLITGRATTGILHMVNKTLLAWFSKRQATVETACLLYTSPSPRDGLLSRMPSSA